MNPSEAVILRVQMVERITRMLKRGDLPRQMFEAGHAGISVYDMARRELGVLAAAPIYMWRSDLFSAAWDAGRALPADVATGPEVQPSESGLFMLPAPVLIDGRGCRALMWDSSWNLRAGAMHAFWLYDDESIPTSRAQFIMMTEPDGRFVDGREVDGREVTGDDKIDHRAVVLACHSTWHWLAQKVAVATIQQASGRAASIAARAGVSSSLNVVQLRRSEGSSGSAEHGSVDWSYQWFVKGHWRRQFLPSTQAHRPIWISPYVKGPDDKPLKAPTSSMFAVNR